MNYNAQRKTLLFFTTLSLILGLYSAKLCASATTNSLRMRAVEHSIRILQTVDLPRVGSKEDAVQLLTSPAFQQTCPELYEIIRNHKIDPDDFFDDPRFGLFLLADILRSRGIDQTAIYLNMIWYDSNNHLDTFSKYAIKPHFVFLKQPFPTSLYLLREQVGCSIILGRRNQLLIILLLR